MLCCTERHSSSRRCSSPAEAWALGLPTTAFSLDSRSRATVSCSRRTRVPKPLAPHSTCSACRALRQASSSVQGLLPQAGSLAGRAQLVALGSSLYLPLLPHLLLHRMRHRLPPMQSFPALTPLTLEAPPSISQAGWGARLQDSCSRAWVVQPDWGQLLQAGESQQCLGTRAATRGGQGLPLWCSHQMCWAASCMGSSPPRPGRCSR